METLSIPAELELPELPVQEFFPSKLASDPICAAALLDAISLFELLGAKWMLAVTVKHWNAEIHEHTADEVRHTKMVQDAAKKLRWAMDADSLLRESRLGRAYYEITEAYLSKLSKKIFLMTRRRAGEAFSVPAYILLAFLIERRIMKIYPHFAKFGATDELKQMAKTLIGDERKHLTFVNNQLIDSLDIAGTTKDAIVAFEENLAKEWLESLTRGL
jgi:hypothetical protein